MPLLLAYATGSPPPLTVYPPVLNPCPVPALPKGARVIPKVYLAKGKVVRPTEGGYAPIGDADGAPVDIFDATDFLFSNHEEIYLVDVDGVVRNEPQLDYLQEISRGHSVWVEAGPRSSDQVIDIVVAGASVAIITTKDFRPLDLEMKRSLALTEEIAMLLKISQGTVESIDSSFSGQDPSELVETAAGWGVKRFILGSAGMGWESVSEMARSAEVYIMDPQFTEMESLRASGAAGAIMEVPVSG